jgi:hypothetical protein
MDDYDGFWSPSNDGFDIRHVHLQFTGGSIGPWTTFREIIGTGRLASETYSLDRLTGPSHARAALLVPKGFGHRLRDLAKNYTIPPMVREIGWES